MPEPYVGEIRMFAGDFPPSNWALCNGQLLSISQYMALFAVIETTYGGDGRNTFGLPDLRGRIPVHASDTLPLGLKGGAETVTLTANELPVHNHQVQISSQPGILADPHGMFVAANAYSNFTSDLGQSSVTMNPQAIEPAGGNEPHDNMMPSLGISFIIALNGIFPARQ